ncbi:BrnT family toxin [Planktotalea arctica]|uniref:BrnT family toxin n=1 Tax=Planktotalea arctica TaxID=1481893 RepID=UPI000A1779F9
MWTTALTREDNRVEYGERRFISIGLIGDRHFVAVWTRRDDALRLISLQKANKREVNIHDRG